MYDYFYGAEAEQFFFYRIPKVLFTEERFRSVSAEAKVLYGLLLDRMSLSCKNGWLDRAGRVYIIFTIEEVMTALGCADQKAGKLLHELESKCRLIERKRQGLGKPNLIYVKNFVDNHVDNTSGSTTPSPESRFQNRENHDSGAVKITDQESLKSRSNNTDKNDTDFSDTDSFPFTSFRRDHGREAKGNEAALREQYRELIAENIAYDALLTDYPYEQDTLEEILELLVDVVCTTKSSVRISGDDKPAEVVRSQFLKLNSEHIRFVMGGLKENTTRIRNMRQYLLATLYNAPLTIGNYYRSLSMHVRSVDQVKAIKTIKRKITDLQKMTIEEQKKAVRSGYDMDIIPSDLATYGTEAKKLLQELQSRNERMFLLTFLVVNVADNRQRLGNNVFQAGSIAQKYNCQLTRLDFQQEEGFMSSLPLGLNQIEIQRGLTTSSVAIFVPFTTQELFQDGKEALYCGLNALSNNLIMVDRKLLKNPNGLILGTPGSGKSFSAKREIANVFLVTNDDIIICDPEAEYGPLVEHLHGQVVKISPTSTDYLNPMDLNLNYSDDENPLSLKSDFILSLCELIVGGKDGLMPVEKTIIDRCVRSVYREYLSDPRPEKMPILEDLYNELRRQDEKEAQYIATALEIYVTGSLNVFNHRSNVNIQNRVVSFDIKELGKQLKKIGMLVVQDAVWNRVTINREQRKSTRYYIDEMHLLLKEEQTAAYTVEIWKRFRKWGGVPTGITQNVKDLLSSREVENIFENSDYVYMLNQASGDRQILAKQLNISPHQLSYVTQSAEGEGLLFYGSVILPFVDRFPKDTELYKIITTKLSDLSEQTGEEAKDAITV